MTPPRVFISYSWSSPDYSARVLALAEHLVADGIDVVLDKWHLKEGQDAFSFMERSVNDPAIARVLVLCDPRYADKANGRSGGVGTETLIISPEVYSEASQTKFVPVVMERADDGTAPLPTHLSGRIYIDLSDAALEPREYERLVRVIYGRPEIERPPLGKPPAFLDETHTTLETGRALAQYKDAVQRDQKQQHGYLDAYLERLAGAYEREAIRVAPTPAELLAAVNASLDRFLPYRDEFVEFADFVARFVRGDDAFDRMHRFLEQLTAIRLRQSPLQWNHEAATENLAFLSRELVVHLVGRLLRTQQFAGLSRLLSSFHVKSYLQSGGTMRGVEALDPPFPQLGNRGDYNRDPVAQLFDRRRHSLLDRATWLDTELFLAIRSRLDPIPPGVHFVRTYLWWPRGFGWEFDASQSELVTRIGDPYHRNRISQALGLSSVGELEERVRLLGDDGFDGPISILSATNLGQLLRVPSV